MAIADMTRPFVLALMGIPGAGKSTAAMWLVDRLTSLRIVSRDRIRDSMFDPCTYSAGERLAAYEAVKLAIPTVLSRGDSVVVDGMCFSESGVLEDLEELVSGTGARFFAVYCDCPLTIALDRVKRDCEEGSHLAKDRDPELVRRVAAQFRTLPEHVSKVDASVHSSDVGKAILRIIVHSEDAHYV